MPRAGGTAHRARRRCLNRSGPALHGPCPGVVIPLFTAGWRDCSEPTTSAPPAPEPAIRALSDHILTRAFHCIRRTAWRTDSRAPDDLAISGRQRISTEGRKLRSIQKPRSPTGWSPWITYRIPSIVLFLSTLPLARAVYSPAARAVRREGDADPQRRVGDQPRKRPLKVPQTAKPMDGGGAMPLPNR